MRLTSGSKRHAGVGARVWCTCSLTDGPIPSVGEQQKKAFLPRARTRTRTRDAGVARAAALATRSDLLCCKYRRYTLFNSKKRVLT